MQAFFTSFHSLLAWLNMILHKLYSKFKESCYHAFTTRSTNSNIADMKIFDVGESNNGLGKYLGDGNIPSMYPDLECHLEVSQNVEHARKSLVGRILKNPKAS